MGWFNGLTKEEDKIIDRLVGLMELSYAAGISKVTTQRTNFFKAIFTQNIATTTWNPGEVRSAACEELQSRIERLTADGTLYNDEQEKIFFKALNDALEELKILPEGMIVEYGRFWYELNPNIRKTYIQDCGKHRYKGVFTQYFKNKKI